MKYDDFKLGDEVEVFYQRVFESAGSWKAGIVVAKTERLEKPRTLSVRTGAGVTSFIQDTDIAAGHLRFRIPVESSDVMKKRITELELKNAELKAIAEGQQAALETQQDLLERQAKIIAGYQGAVNQIVRATEAL